MAYSYLNADVVITSESPENLTKILKEVNIRNPGVKTVYVDTVRSAIGFDENFSKLVVEYSLTEAEKLLQLARREKRIAKIEGDKEIIYL